MASGVGKAARLELSLELDGSRCAGWSDWLLTLWTSSAKMQATLQMSTAREYFEEPSSTSGARYHNVTICSQHDGASAVLPIDCQSCFCDYATDEHNNACWTRMLQSWSAARDNVDCFMCCIRSLQTQYACSCLL